jgi:hypothetical protein
MHTGLLASFEMACDKLSDSKLVKKGTPSQHCLQAMLGIQKFKGIWKNVQLAPLS